MPVTLIIFKVTYMNKTLKLFFGSIMRNDAVILGAKETWYWAVGLFILSTLIATAPTYISGSSSKGSDFLNGTTYSVENGLQTFVEALYENDVDLIIQESTVEGSVVHTLVNESTTFETAFPLSVTEGFHYHLYSDRLRVYYQGQATDAAAAAFVADQLALPGASELISFLFLGNKGISFYIYNPADIGLPDTTGADYTERYEGDYLSIPADTNLKDFAVKDTEGTVYPYEDRADDYPTYQTRVFSNWKHLFDQSFEGYRAPALLYSVSVMFGLNVFMAATMAIMVFILTRGKKNPNNHYNVWDSFKIASWSLFTPSVLAFFTNLLFPTLLPSTMAFVLFVGLRMMWLSSSYLRPYQETPVKK